MHIAILTCMTLGMAWGIYAGLLATIVLFAALQW